MEGGGRLLASIALRSFEALDLGLQCTLGFCRGLLPGLFQALDLGLEPVFVLFERA